MARRSPRKADLCPGIRVRYIRSSMPTIIIAVVLTATAAAKHNWVSFASGVRRLLRTPGSRPLPLVGDRRDAVLGHAKLFHGTRPCREHVPPCLSDHARRARRSSIGTPSVVWSRPQLSPVLRGVLRPNTRHMMRSRPALLSRSNPRRRSVRSRPRRRLYSAC